MKISAFVTISDPEKRLDPYIECIRNMVDFADEVVVVDGGKDTRKIQHANVSHNEYINRLVGLAEPGKIKIIYHEWPNEFTWKFIGNQFQRGYETCTGDWVFRFDCDYIINKEDFQPIRDYLEKCDAPACTMPKKQFILVDRFNIKSLTPIAYNKGKYGNRIRLDSGGDLCAPSLDGIELQKCSWMEKPKTEYEMPIISRKQYIVADETDSVQMERLPNVYREGDFFIQERGIPFYCYDFSFKTKDVIYKDFGRFARAWHKHFKKWTLGGEGKTMEESNKSAFDYFMKMQLGRLSNSGWTQCGLEEHPEYIRERVKNITKDQFGYDAFGEFRP